MKWIVDCYPIQSIQLPVGWSASPPPSHYISPGAFDAGKRRPTAWASHNPPHGASCSNLTYKAPDVDWPCRYVVFKIANDQPSNGVVRAVAKRSLQQGPLIWVQSTRDAEHFGEAWQDKIQRLWAAKFVSGDSVGVVEELVRPKENHREVSKSPKLALQTDFRYHPTHALA